MTEMPQPLSKVIPKPPATGIRITWNWNIASTQPELAALVAHAIAIWSLVEFTLGQIFVDILGAEIRPAFAMYSALNSERAKIDALTAAALSTLEGENRLLFQALMKIYESKGKQRHKFAHWIWAYCELTPDCLILIDPARMLEGHAIMTELMHGLTDSVLGIPFSDEWFAYSKPELERIVQEFSEILNIFRHFQTLIRPHPSPLTPQAYNYLNTQPLVQKALSLVRPKNNKSEPEYSI